MIEVNGVAWTDANETQAIRQKFRDKHHGTEEAPQCKFCKRTTEYVMEHWKSGLGFLKPGVNMLQKLMKFSVLVDEEAGIAYIPVTDCWRCGAAYDGASGAPEPDWSKRAMLPANREAAKQIYYRKRDEMLAKKAAENEKKAARYA